MLTKTVVDALNEQINREIYSSYLYLAMAAWSESGNRRGMAHWLRLQSKEEYGHAMKILGYIEDHGARVALKAIAEPPAEFMCPLELFHQVLAHEKKISSNMHDLHALATKEKDIPTQIFLQWFVTEQVEEEKNASEIVENFKLVGDAPGAVFMIDRHLATRQ
jgi:ferritin